MAGWGSRGTFGVEPCGFHKVFVTYNSLIAALVVHGSLTF